MLLKPIIGITSDLSKEQRVNVSHNNISAITEAGGLPLVLPNVMDQDTIQHYAEVLDGLLLTGGGDIDPSYFEEEPHPNLGRICPERDFFEIELIRQMLPRNKPILGICRGCQILNVAIGGDMYQDIHAQHETPLLQHNQQAPYHHCSHFVEVKENSLLYNIVKSNRFKVNSFHHQAVRRVGEGFAVCAAAGDGVIEAFESAGHRFAIGVQWHPEHLKDEYSARLFRAFVECC